MPNKKDKKTNSEKEKFQSLEKENNELKNIAARAQADLVNYRNRMKNELLEIEQRTTKNLVLKILSVIDDIDLAIENSSEASKNVLSEGLISIRSKFENILKLKNINVIEENNIFDPYIHEALLKTDTKDMEDGSILRILRKGYVMNNEVIRPTQVEIAENLTNKNYDKENENG
ncbi:MAG: nucleotide exchange factor GrpE [Chloroflexi bacterium]|nr:nucleotide exchange factor GrpE [Chloroflexota bacterium]|tara:strand:+ start:2190 stop:2711 length:522 start_codon:yes stop_codon:yes gene_type:complete